MLKYFLLLGWLQIFPGIAVAAQTETILIVGDSLSASYGIEQHVGWVALLQQRLKEQGYPHQVVNASISGETTRGAVSRMAQALKNNRPTICIIELGGNDGLRGLSLSEMESNLASLIKQCQRQNAKVLLAGMALPPNYGVAYTKAFSRVYVDLAKRHSVTLLPFLLNGLNGTEQFQSDGIHPTAAAQSQIRDNVWPYLSPLLRKK